MVGWTAAPSAKHQRLFLICEISRLALVVMLTEQSRAEQSSMRRTFQNSTRPPATAVLFIRGPSTLSRRTCANICQTAWALGLDWAVPHVLSESVGIIIIKKTVWGKATNYKTHLPHNTKWILGNCKVKNQSKIWHMIWKGLLYLTALSPLNQYDHMAFTQIIIWLSHSSSGSGANKLTWLA